MGCTTKVCMCVSYQLRRSSNPQCIFSNAAQRPTVRQWRLVHNSDRTVGQWGLVHSDRTVRQWRLMHSDRTVRQWRLVNDRSPDSGGWCTATVPSGSGGWCTATVPSGGGGWWTTVSSDSGGWWTATYRQSVAAGAQQRQLRYKCRSLVTLHQFQSSICLYGG